MQGCTVHGAKDANPVISTTFWIPACAGMTIEELTGQHCVKMIGVISSVFVDVTVSSRDAGAEPPWTDSRRVTAMNTGFITPVFTSEQKMVLL